jgi:hypothetical protein
MLQTRAISGNATLFSVVVQFPCLAAGLARRFLATRRASAAAKLFIAARQPARGSDGAQSRAADKSRGTSLRRNCV